MKKTIWKNKPNLEQINTLAEGSLSSVLGIRYENIDDHSLSATMPVSQKTSQPFGSLHGGASAAFAESVGSMAAHFCCDSSKEAAAGVDLTIHHLRSTDRGILVATAKAVRIGKSIQVWQVSIRQEDRLISFATLTVKITKQRSNR
ncbi:MAG: PaaI family thioesterase [Chlamydiota bacterium]